MISEELLQEAAKEAGTALSASLPAPSQCDCTPPPAFTRRMKRLIHSLKHPTLYRSLRTAAIFFLACALSSALLLASNPSARASFVGWLTRQVQNAIEYSFPENDLVPMGETAYRPSWIPEGYTEYKTQLSTGSGSISYIDEELNRIGSFGFAHAASTARMYVIPEGSIFKTVMLGDIQADLYLSDDPAVSNSIVWEDPEKQVCFMATFHGDENVLIKIAESVIEYMP